MRLRVLELSDAPAWLAGEDEEQLKWFQMPAASLQDVERAIEGWQAGWRDGASIRHWGIWVADALGGGVELRVREVDAVVAIVDERNTASRRVAENAGFTLDGSAEPWEHTESGVMLRYVLRAAGS